MFRFIPLHFIYIIITCLFISRLNDIKHKTACLLKAQLGKDENWKLFTEQATQTKSQLQQTVLSHLKPPNQRSKARYMNIEILLNWALETLEIINSEGITLNGYQVLTTQFQENSPI